MLLRHSIKPGGSCRLARPAFPIFLHSQTDSGSESIIGMNDFVCTKE